MPNELKPCPFCEAVPVKDERSSANGYLIPHKKGCLLENYFPRIQEGHVEKWKNISTTRPNQEDLAEELAVCQETMQNLSRKLGKANRKLDEISLMAE